MIYKVWWKFSKATEGESSAQYIRMGLEVPCRWGSSVGNAAIAELRMYTLTNDVFSRHRWYGLSSLHFSLDALTLTLT